MIPHSLTTNLAGRRVARAARWVAVHDADLISGEGTLRLRHPWAAPPLRGRLGRC